MRLTKMNMTLNKAGENEFSRAIDDVRLIGIRWCNCGVPVIANDFRNAIVVEPNIANEYLTMPVLGKDDSVAEDCSQFLISTFAFRLTDTHETIDKIELSCLREECSVVSCEADTKRNDVAISKINTHFNNEIATSLQSHKVATFVPRKDKNNE